MYNVSTNLLHNTYTLKNSTAHTDAVLYSNFISEPIEHAVIFKDAFNATQLLFGYQYVINPI